MSTARRYRLTGADGREYPSREPGEWGGHRRARIYGRLDCPAALRSLARGHYATNRVFFRDEDVAIAAGYRPCGTCCRKRYREWRRERGEPGTAVRADDGTSR